MARLGCEIAGRMEKIVSRALGLVLAAIVWIACAVQSFAFELDMPLICEPGKTCWVQQYPDHDATAGAQDYLCGSAVYDGHDGTDIRVLDTSTTAPVVAAAAGTVTGVRDGVADNLMKTDADKAAVANRECGNGVVINHGNGWETQYCHMKMGTVIVKTGAKVLSGERLGDVGYSGAAAFPHVHLTVRKNKRSVDPFSGPMKDDCAAEDKSMWSESARAKLAYAESAVLRLGFSDRKIKLDELETGSVAESAPSSTWPIVLGYAWAINLKKGDNVLLKLEAPGEQPAENEITLDRNKAVYFLFAGKKRPESGWPPGQYKLTFTVKNDSKIRVQQERTFEIAK